MNKKLIGFFALAAILLMTPPAFALNMYTFRPIPDNLGTIRLHGSRTLEKYQFSVGFFESYTDNPLTIKGFAVAPTSRQVVERIIASDIVAEMGLHERISVGLDIPFMNISRVDSATLSTVPVYKKYWRLGDMAVYGKFRILKDSDYPIGFSVVPYIEFPTGSESKYTGDKNLDIGFKGVVDWQNDRFYAGANIGVRGHTQTDELVFAGVVNTLKVGTELTYGVGGRVDIIPGRLQFLADIAGSTPFADFAKYERSSPIEALGGFRAFFKNRMIGVHLGAGSGLNRGYGNAKFRVYAGVNFQYPETKPAALAQQKPLKIVTTEQERTMILKGVYFETARAILRPESYETLDENIKMLKENPDIDAIIEGHTDNRGSDEYNQRLSEDRANSVMQYFIDHGIDKSRLRAVGMGEKVPIVPNTSDENMSKNRRIEMKMIVKNKLQEVVDEKGRPVKVDEVKKKEERKKKIR